MGKIITDWLERYKDSPDFKEEEQLAYSNFGYDLTGFLEHLIEVGAKTYSSQLQARWERKRNTT